MDADTEKWLHQLVKKLVPHTIYFYSKDQLVGYVWNSRKKQLRFLSQKEADHLTHKRVVWKHLKEDWT